MNSETAIVVAVVLAITIILGVAIFYSASLDEIGASAFGENSDGGYFTPGEDQITDFPTQGNSEQKDSNLEGGYKSYDSF